MESNAESLPRPDLETRLQVVGETLFKLTTIVEELNTKILQLEKQLILTQKTLRNVCIDTENPFYTH